MTYEMLAAFASELESIETHLTKEAGLLATALKKTEAFRSKIPLLKKLGPKPGPSMRENIVGAVHDVLHPVSSSKKAWKDSKWMGEGLAKDHKKLKGFDKHLDTVTSLGGATKHLPVGMKSLTVGGAAATAPEAFKKEDSSGRGRSRMERIGGWAAGTAGGLATMNRGMIGGIAGTMGAERAGSAIGRAVAGRRKPPVPDQGK